MPELTYNDSATALQMAELIFGDNVTVTGASYTGDSDASAIYSDGDTISPGVVPSDTGVILSVTTLSLSVHLPQQPPFRRKAAPLHHP